MAWTIQRKARRATGERRGERGAKAVGACPKGRAFHRTRGGLPEAVSVAGDRQIGGRGTQDRRPC